MKFPLTTTGRLQTRTISAGRSDAETVWRTDLPKEWRQMVITPLSLETYRDYEMAAERCIGRDEDDIPCYSRSHFIVTETRSDDDEEFYQVAAYAESQTAWRLRDGRWLIHRIISRDGEPGRSFFSFGESMPR
jgi:hypothetical protein